MIAPVVAIDGGAGSGKSTLARRLAATLHLPYVNTGAMYRALTLAARRHGVNLDDGSALSTLMQTLDFSVSGPAPGELWIDGGPPESALESADVEAHVSTVAGHPEVRSAMRDAQRALGDRGAVMEGRDIGTVVFPDARVKLFLDADPSERAGRRALEREHAAAAGALHERDHRDSQVNPLVPASDAILIDTSELDVEETLRQALAVIAAHAPELIA